MKKTALGVTSANPKASCQVHPATDDAVCQFQFLLCSLAANCLFPTVGAFLKGAFPVIYKLEVCQFNMTWASCWAGTRQFLSVGRTNSLALWEKSTWQVPGRRVCCRGRGGQRSGRSRGKGCIQGKRHPFHFHVTQKWENTRRKMKQL